MEILTGKKECNQSQSKLRIKYKKGQQKQKLCMSESSKLAAFLFCSVLFFCMKLAAKIINNLRMGRLSGLAL